MAKARATFNSLGLGAIFALLWLFSAAAAPDERFRPQAQKIYDEAELNYSAQPENATNAWLFAKACFDLAEFSKTDPERARLAQKGIEGAEAAIAAAPNSAAGHYYLALNKGQLARTKSLGALPIVTQMEKHLQRAIQLDKQFDYAGPHRIIGLLYLDAPGWPTSIGNKKKARQHLESAVSLAPEFPENHLSLLEALLEMKERKRASELLPETARALKQARQNFTGEPWAQSWADWEPRWAAIQEQLR